MRKLLSVREHLLKSGLGIPPDELLTFAEKGSVTSYRGDPSRNSDFQVDYSAHLIITNFAGDPVALFFVAVQWLHRECPDAAPDAIKFHVDVIKHGVADIMLLIPLSETVSVEQLPAGIRLTLDVDPDAAAFDMAALLFPAAS